MQRAHAWHRAVFAAVLGTATLAGCDTPPSKADMGTVAGAAIGGVLGSTIGKGGGRTAAIIGGAVLGGFIGRSIGQHMDDSDRREMAQALESTPTGQTASWRNPDSGNNFEMTPTRDYTSAAGHPCRDFVQQVIVDGQPKTVEGSACKEPDTAVWTSS